MDAEYAQTPQGEHLLALANHQDGLSVINSKIFKWNGPAFDPYRVGPQHGALHHGHHAVLGNFKMSRFQPEDLNYERFRASARASHWEYFEVQGTHFLALARYREGATWARSNFKIQIIISGAQKFKHFATAGGLEGLPQGSALRHSLAVANLQGSTTNYYIDSKVFEWSLRRSPGN